MTPEAEELARRIVEALESKRDESYRRVEVLYGSQESVLATAYEDAIEIVARIIEEVRHERS
jgi:hypothetical protein